MPAHACSSCEQLNPWAAECERRGERSAAGGRRRGLVVVRRPALEEPALEELALEELALEEAEPAPHDLAKGGPEHRPADDIRSVVDLHVHAARADDDGQDIEGPFTARASKQCG